jgi:3-deoxy-D-manno-octulosonate 8-phosphate phosphatase (KDO 8-P phosphatase)
VAGEDTSSHVAVELNAKIPAMPTKSSAPNRASQARAKKIKLLLFDVDGVLTDGKLFLFPVPTASPSDKPIVVEAKGFHAHDGAGISIARIAGIKSGLITRRKSDTVALRARDLRLEYVRQGSHDKLKALREILAEAGLSASEVAFVGDDVIDLPAMRNCGFAVAVANARREVKDESHYVTPHAGGDGALRDVIEFILKAQGKWKQAVGEYIRGESGGNN